MPARSVASWVRWQLRRCRPSRGLLLLLLLVVGSREATAAVQRQGVIRGTVVTDAGETLAQVEVLLIDADRRTHTDADGEFEFAELPPGDYLIVAENATRASPERTVALRAGGRVEVVLRMVPRPITLPPMIVLGSPGERQRLRREAAEAPGTVVHLGPADIEATRRANLADLLRYVPGVYVQPKFGAADKVQLSIRGSGLRSAFEIQGVNVLVNGAPYRNADGFADLESLELLTVDNLQVYHAGNAFRYGGSTLGGAINLQTKSGHTASPLEAVLQGGSYGFVKGQAAAGGVHGDFDHYVSFARTDLDGYRELAANERDRFTAHVGWASSPSFNVRALYTFAAVREERPGSLTREEFEADPRQANPSAVNFRSGRDYDQHHLGLRARTRLGDAGVLQVAPYLQLRSLEVRTFRVIDQQLDDYGIDASYEVDSRPGADTHRLVVGVQAARGSVDNRHSKNVEGRRGDLVKHQDETAAAIGVYAEDRFGITERLSAIVGLRYDWSLRAVDDLFVGDDGDRAYEEWTRALSPRFGLVYDLPSISGHAFANASRLHSPPMLVELDDLTGPGFLELRPQKAWQLEIGMRGRRGDLGWSLAVYDIELRDEILNINIRPFPDAEFTVPSHRNAERTRHYGFEAGLDYAIPLGPKSRHVLAGRAAYTFSRYEFVRDSTFTGNQIPGVPPHVLQAELVYRDRRGVEIGASVEWVPEDYFLDSQNTVRNDGWTVFRARGEWTIPSSELLLFLEAHNLTDERYAPAVNADNAAGRYLLPAVGRSVTGGVRWRL